MNGKHYIGIIDGGRALLTWTLHADLRFSASGEVWNRNGTDITHGGQCVAELAAQFPDDTLAQAIAAMHATHHLRVLNTDEQAAQIRAWQGTPEPDTDPLSDFGVTCEFVPNEAGDKIRWLCIVTYRDLSRPVMLVPYTQGIGHAPAYRKTWATPHDKNIALRLEAQTGRIVKKDWRGVAGGQTTKPLPHPTKADVIGALLSDASCFLNAPTWPEFAANLGYDEDSIKSYEIFCACRDQTLKLQAAIGRDQMEELINGN